MSPESSGSMGLEDARWPDDGHRPEDDSDDDWPDDDETGDETGMPWPGGSPGPPRAWDGGPRPGRVRPLAVAAVAVVALAVGAGVAAVVARGPSSSPSATQAPSSSQPTGIPGGIGTPGGGGAFGQLLLAGKVVTVSSTSITIAGGTHTVTAAVTSSTRVTGKVTSIGAVRVGDFVSAQISESNGKATATAIQDPARPGSLGGLPPVGGNQP
jgi:hypothetical protein